MTGGLAGGVIVGAPGGRFGSGGGPSGDCASTPPETAMPNTTHANDRYLRRTVRSPEVLRPAGFPKPARVVP